MPDPTSSPPPRPLLIRLASWSVLVLVWLALAVVIAGFLFVTSSRSTVIASHDAVISPTYDGQVTVRSGPFLPDLRWPSDHRIGVAVTLGKTEARSPEELAERYALIASHPRGQVAKAGRLLRDMAVAAALRGGVLALPPVLVWVLLGAQRRRTLAGKVRWPVVVADALVVVLLAVLVWQPWQGRESQLESTAEWQPIQEYLAGLPVPEEVSFIEVRTDVTALQTRRLVQSAVDTYERSRVFYAEAQEAAEELELRQPAEDETVALLVADRHDNIGMDAVARTIADRGQATAILNGGDDTSTGEPWEAFSLDSLHEAFGDLDKYAVPGNHDHGPFVPDYLSERGWTILDGEVVEGPGGSRLLGEADPRASGLGTWRDETATTFAEQSQQLADTACAADERVNTLLVHDPNIGNRALARGCVDLVVGGHHHTREGPDPVVGENGQRGYRYFNGTTGGAAYAIAVGSKLRRPAEVSLVTYREGRPVGLQWVILKTNGRFEVGEYVELELTPLGEADREPAGPPLPDGTE
ncbi:metallophosphoesterase [Nocardioides sp.]|uniref:metallophosphoesterase family protein n=1 Tax=Nocardioides sp. TaxID=35761 RepID=UPI0027357479|nr:metallophosphoesterase [Nocardioides sp.]MDP3893176.1 metallophosphoesterase [Nocardioides sp.]